MKAKKLFSGIGAFVITAGVLGTAGCSEPINYDGNTKRSTKAIIGW